MTRPACSAAASSNSSKRSGRERCHIVLFDDLAADPEATYRGMCAFLGIEP